MANAPVNQIYMNASIDQMFPNPKKQTQTFFQNDTININGDTHFAFFYIFITEYYRR